MKLCIIIIFSRQRQKIQNDNFVPLPPRIRAWLTKFRFIEHAPAVIRVSVDQEVAHVVIVTTACELSVIIGAKYKKGFKSSRSQLLREYTLDIYGSHTHYKIQETDYFRRGMRNVVSNKR